MRTARDMAGKLLYILHYYAPALFPGRAAHPTAVSNTGTCHRPLKRSEHQLALPTISRACITDCYGRSYHIKTDPEKAESLFESRRDIGQIGRHIGLVLDKGTYLRQQLLISESLVLMGKMYLVHKETVYST